MNQYNQTDCPGEFRDAFDTLSTMDLLAMGEISEDELAELLAPWDDEAPFAE